MYKIIVSIFLSLFLLTGSISFARSQKSERFEIYFKLGQSKVLSEKGSSSLKSLYKSLKKLPKAQVYITGHTDNLGSRRFNIRLSEKRASYISDKLVEKGVRTKRIFLKGVGESFPTANNKENSGRTKNRRVTVTFTYLKKEPKEDFTPNIQYQSLSEMIDEVLESKIESKKENKLVQNTLLEESLEGEIEEEYAVIRYSIFVGGGQSLLDVDHKTTPSLSSDWKSVQDYFAGGAFQVQVSKYWVGFRLKGMLQDYEVKGTPSFTWNEQVPFLIRGAIITDYETSRWGLGADLDLNKESFLIEALGTAKFSDEMLVGLTLRGKYKWLNTARYSSRLFLNLSLPFSGNGDIGSKGRLGYVLAADIRLAKVLGSHDLRLKAYYGFRKFSNEQSDQEEEVLGLQLSLDSALWL